MLLLSYSHQHSRLLPLFYQTRILILSTQTRLWPIRLCPLTWLWPALTTRSRLFRSSRIPRATVVPRDPRAQRGPSAHPDPPPCPSSPLTTTTPSTTKSRAPIQRAKEMCPVSVLSLIPVHLLLLTSCTITTDRAPDLHGPTAPQPVPALARDHPTPDRGPLYPDRDPLYPDRGPLYPDSAPRHPDRDLCFPDSAPSLPDNVPNHFPDQLMLVSGSGWRSKPPRLSTAVVH